jgi:hypothetical protein
MWRMCNAVTWRLGTRGPDEDHNDGIRHACLVDNRLSRTAESGNLKVHIKVQNAVLSSRIGHDPARTASLSAQVGELIDAGSYRLALAGVARSALRA